MDEWIGRIVEGTVYKLGADQAVVGTGVCSEAQSCQAPEQTSAWLAACAPRRILAGTKERNRGIVRSRRRRIMHRRSHDSWNTNTRIITALVLEVGTAALQHGAPNREREGCKRCCLKGENIKRTPKTRRKLYAI